MARLVNYRLDDELLDALKARAKTDMRTMTATVAMILRNSLTKSGHYNSGEKKVNMPTTLTLEDYLAEKDGEIDGQFDAKFINLFCDEIKDLDEGEWETDDDGEKRLMLHRDHLNEAWATAEKLFESGEY